jgi:hypothetical protein
MGPSLGYFLMYALTLYSARPRIAPGLALQSGARPGFIWCGVKKGKRGDDEDHGLFRRGMGDLRPEGNG